MLGFLHNLPDFVLYLRTHSYGKCYIIAATVFVCYVAQFHGYAIAPIDVCKYIRHSYSDGELIELVEKDSGGDPVSKAQDMLENLSGKSLPRLKLLNIADLRDENRIDIVAKYLNDYGPGLMSSFKCHKNFGKTNSGETLERVRDLDSVGVRRYFSNPKHRSKPQSGFRKFETIQEAKESGYFQGNYDDSELQQPERLLFTAESDLSDKSNKTEATESTTSSSSDEDEHGHDQEPVRMQSRDEYESSDKLEDSKNTASAEDGFARGHGFRATYKNSLHTMIILHARKDKKDQTWWFLMQNWWPDMQLVEVSEEYLADSEALLDFVNSNISFTKTVEAVYKKNTARIAHCNDMDRAAGGGVHYDVGLRHFAGRDSVGA